MTLGNVAVGRHPLRANAEIVVLARAFEFAASPMATNVTATAEGCLGSASQSTEGENSFLDLTTPSLSAARVIYYSPDIENGQSLNLSNIPIVGPSCYKGRPVGVQIIVLELDRVSPEIRGLLSSLASLGQTTGALPTGPAVGVLTELGSSLLTSNQDDIIFEYRFVLDRSDRANEVRYASFEEGRYVLRRLHHRSNTHVWRNLELDHNTGQLFTFNSNDGHRIYRAETYFTLNIINHGPGAAEAVYAHRSLADLRTAIEQSATADDAQVRLISSSITGLSNNVRRDVLVRDLTQQWEAAVADAIRVGQSTAPSAAQLDSNVCDMVEQSNRDLHIARFSLARNLAKFRTDWDAAVASNQGTTPSFGNPERLRVAANVSSFFAGLNYRVADTDRLAPETFASVDQFQALVAGDLNAKVVKYAEAMAPRDCAAAIAAGFAQPVTAPPQR